MKQTNKEQEELLLVYETLIATLEECKASQLLERFSIDVEKQIKDFEEAYPEIVSEYHFVNK